MGKIGLIIKREYFTRVRKKSFIIMTFLGPILIGTVLGIALWFSMLESGTEKVLVVDDSYAIADYLKNTDRIYFYQTTADLETAKQHFKDSSFTSLLWIPQNIVQDQDGYCHLYYKTQPGKLTQRTIENQISEQLLERRLEDYDVPRDTFLLLNTPALLDPIDIDDDGKDEASNDELKMGIGFGFSVIIYMFIFLYGVQVMRGVIEEKTNRIVEIIISSVKPFQLMMGKIIGIALVGLTQFLLWVLLTLVITTIVQTAILGETYDPSAIAEVQMSEELQTAAQGETGDLNEVMEMVNSVNWPLLLGMFLFYFLGGYLLYSSLFAAVGAAVDAETETQQFMLPITIPLIVGFIVAQMVIVNPEGPAAFWFSIIPFTSPVVMLVRVAVGIGDGGVPYWEVGLSMSLLIIGFLFTTWLAGKIYRTGILMYGKKVSYKELWKWLFYKG